MYSLSGRKPELCFVCWFPETYKTLSGFLVAENLLMADRAGTALLENKMIVFAEHHPLSRKEITLFKQLNLKEAPVLSSLDEPLFMRFGGERTIELMKKLGMQEDEVIGSGLITKALHNAQLKIEKQVIAEQEAASQQEWFERNLIK